ncbi:hypothetical protein JL721_5509 [Aureococcus anophagefferens]|nr:hypothetical protein JL721_5509 [Aureococcus anophagefferens]
MAASTRSTVLVCCALFAYVLVMWGEWRVMPTTTTPAASAESEASAEIAALRRRAQQLEALLAAAPKDAPPPRRDGAADGAAEPAAEPYGERCFDGADDFDRAALNMFGHGLTEFSLSLSLRVAEPGEPCGDLPTDESPHFHSGGCGLASGVRGFLKDRDAWSDWGLSLARDGALLFGYGHRDFGTATDMAGTARGEARPVRDTTLRAPKGDGGADLLDGAWHDVVVVRKRTSPNRKKDDVDPYGSPVVGPHCTSELYVYVDGARRAGSFAVSGGRTGDSALNNAVTKAGGSPGYKGSAPLHRGRALEVKLGGGSAAASGTDAASRDMRDKFVASIRDGASDVVLREWVIGASKEDQTQRFGTKIELVLRAIRENPRDSVVIVSDMDLRFYKPMAPVIDAYIGVGDPYDVDIALKCNKAVADVFRTTGEIMQQNRPGATGDQRIINRALANPWVYGMPRLKWAVLPSEIATNSVVNDHTKDAMYGANFNNWVLFHANDYGRAGLESSKARIAKMKLLTDAENMVAQNADARKPRDRWPYVGPEERRVFPSETEGG